MPRPAARPPRPADWKTNGKKIPVVKRPNIGPPKTELIAVHASAIPKIFHDGPWILAECVTFKISENISKSNNESTGYQHGKFWNPCDGTLFDFEIWFQDVFNDNNRTRIDCGWACWQRGAKDCAEINTSDTWCYDGEEVERKIKNHFIKSSVYQSYNMSHTVWLIQYSSYWRILL